MRNSILRFILLTQLLMVVVVDAARPFGFGRQRHSVSTTSSTTTHHDHDHRHRMARAEDGLSSPAVSDVVVSRRTTADGTKSTRQCKDEPGDDRSARFAFCRDAELKALQRTEHAYVVMEENRNGNEMEDMENRLTPCQRWVPRDESGRLGGGAFGSDLLVA